MYTGIQLENDGLSIDGYSFGLYPVTVLCPNSDIRTVPTTSHELWRLRRRAQSRESGAWGSRLHGLRSPEKLGTARARCAYLQSAPVLGLTMTIHIR